LSLRNLKTEFDMRHRPIRNNYPIGKYGDIDYYERLERYCTYLENKNKALTEQCNIANVVGQSEQCVLHSTDWNGKCFKCGEQVFVREDK